MIKLSRLDSEEIAINCDLIAWIEACPDTTIRMLAGERILVRESLEEVLLRIAGYRSGVLRDAGLDVLLTAGSTRTIPAALMALEQEERALEASEVSP